MDALTLMKTKENNNAAIVVNKPSTCWDHQETPVTLSMDNVVLASYSGKGIINRNPACQISQNDCFVSKIGVGW